MRPPSVMFLSSLTLRPTMISLFAFAIFEHNVVLMELILSLSPPVPSSGPIRVSCFEYECENEFLLDRF